MDNAYANEDLALILLPVLYLLLVVHLVALLESPNNCSTVIEHVNRVSSLIADDIVRNKLERLYLTAFSQILPFLFLRLLLPSCHSFIQAHKHLAGEVEHDVSW